MNKTSLQIKPPQVKTVLLPRPFKAKPFLKWAGGKTQLLKKFHPYFPIPLQQGLLQGYYEPFVGSGAVFFDLMQRFPFKQAYLYDINPDLILTYRVIQAQVMPLIALLQDLTERYLAMTPEDRKIMFYQVRQDYNEGQFAVRWSRLTPRWITRAAQLIFLNKTCYNGLYRVNRQGYFNAPMGAYRQPRIFTPENLVAVSHLLQRAEIRQGSFADMPRQLSAKDFVYFDPPYRPLNRTAHFTAYTRYEFRDPEQRQLATLFRKLAHHGTQVMLSNSDPRNTNPDEDFMEKLYAPFYIYRVPARRAINAKASGRGYINELIITSYPCVSEENRSLLI